MIVGCAGPALSLLWVLSAVVDSRACKAVRALIPECIVLTTPIHGIQVNHCISSIPRSIAGASIVVDSISFSFDSRTI